MHEILLECEGGVAKEDRQEIDQAVERKLVFQKEKEIISNMTETSLAPSAVRGFDSVSKKHLGTVAGERDLHFIAMQHLGFEHLPEYPRLYREVSGEKTFGVFSTEQVYRGCPMD